MAQIEQSDKGGKKKKGAQKKMAIHVDFTPMVDMNMLLITFFMLCTTMIKSQTLQLVLPAPPKDDAANTQNQNEASIDETITLIFDTEIDEKTGVPAVDENGKTKHIVYYYEGLPDSIYTPNSLKVEKFIGNSNGSRQGIRKVLYERNKTVMTKYDDLKKQWREGKITKEEFDSIAKENAKDKSIKDRPVVRIKPGPNATYEGFIYAFDEVQSNQISRYSIESLKPEDERLINGYKESSKSK